MNLFIMYMSGNSISIFPIMMVVMMMFRSVPTETFIFLANFLHRPFKTLVSVNQVFKPFESGANGLGVNILGQKLVFILGNLAGVALAMFKCHSMGLLPTHASDWLAFADPLERAEVGPFLLLAIILLILLLIPLPIIPNCPAQNQTHAHT